MISFFDLLFVHLGILLCYTLGSYIDWKILATIGAILPMPFLVFMWFIPETPRWYISQGATLINQYL